MNLIEILIPFTEARLSKERHRLRPFEARYRELVRGANRRGHKVELTYEDYLTFTILNCHYCNATLNWNPYTSTGRAGYGRNLINIDRKNSFGDYTLDNCVPCCPNCNRRKGRKSYKKFKIGRI